MKKFLLLLLSTISVNSYSQDQPLYSQYGTNLLVVNPAYAGFREQLRVDALWRKQWTGLPNSPTTQTLTANSTIPIKNMGLGLIFNNDQYGYTSTQQAYIVPSYSIKVGNTGSQLKFGMNIGFMKTKIDFDELRLKQFDPNFENVNTNAIFSYGAGFIYRHKVSHTHDLFFVGASIPKLYEVNVLDRHYEKELYIISGILIEPTHLVKLKVSSLIKMVESDHKTFDLSGTLYLLDEVLAGGLSFRSSIDHLEPHSVILSGHINMKNHMSFGAAYDVPLNTLIVYPSFEISATINVEVFHHHRIGHSHF
jgi:type IX secretion system PorP/SprF family membrane protein